MFKYKAAPEWISEKGTVNYKSNYYQGKNHGGDDQQAPIPAGGRNIPLPDIAVGGQDYAYFPCGRKYLFVHKFNKQTALCPLLASIIPTKLLCLLKRGGQKTAPAIYIIGFRNTNAGSPHQKVRAASGILIIFDYTFLNIS